MTDAKSHRENIHRKRRISFLITTRELKLLVVIGILDARTRASINHSKPEDRQIRITFQYETLYKLIGLTSTSVSQATGKKKETLRNFHKKLQHLIKLFDRVGKKSDL